MKLTTFIATYILATILALSTAAQGTFENLNFEQANPVAVGPFTVTAASAIPDWTAAIGGVQQTDIGENTFSAGSPEVVIITPASTQQPPLDGDYSVLLTGSFSSASISQTVEIPDGTQSLWFDAEPFPRGGPLVVTIGNDSLTLFPVQTGVNFNVYGANISAWAGQTQPLTFTAVGNNTTFNVWEIDDISFSPNPISITPEPDALTLMSVGGLLFGLYRRFQSTRK